jgi:hypothetical protein
VHVDAVGTAVDLRNAKEHKVDKFLRQIRFLGYIVVDTNRAFAPSGAISCQFKRVISVLSCH